MFIVVFIITILLLVVIHEFGHYIACKKFNIKVLEFGFGLPPRIWGKKIGETLWSINAIPAGGFVRPLGEDEDLDAKGLIAQEKKEWEERSFQTQTPGKKILVVAAGVVMNLLLAWVLYWIVLGAQGFQVQVPLITDHKFFGATQTNEKVFLVDTVSADSPAQKAGILSNDRLVAVNGQALTSTDQLISFTKSEAGKPISVTLSDFQNKKRHDVTLVPRANPPANQGAIGISFGELEMAHLDYSQPWQILLAGPIHSYNVADYSIEIFSKTIQVAFQTKDFTPVRQNVAGPIGITKIVGQILDMKDPLIPYLDFVAILSLNLAVVNVLPFPGLDGGRLFFLVIEAITRKKVNQTFEKYVHTVGLAILLTLIVLITVSDIKKLF
jgi:regulator of sigma E protease